jgi:hypothetical protein
LLSRGNTDLHPNVRNHLGVKKKPRQSQYLKKSEQQYQTLLSESDRVGSADPDEIMKLTHKHMLIFKSVLGLSQNMTLMANTLLKNFFRRNSVVDSGLKQFLINFNLKFELYFDVISIAGVNGVCSNDAAAVIQQACNLREIDPRESVLFIKLMPDTGDKLLKVSTGVK